VLVAELLELPEELDEPDEGDKSINDAGWYEIVLVVVKLGELV
jgi:hypothetical protein